MVINELLKTFLNKLQVLLLILKLKSYNFLEVCITIFINPCFLISNLLTFYCVTYNLGKVIIKNIIRSRSNRDKLLLNNSITENFSKLCYCIWSFSIFFNNNIIKSIEINLAAFSFVREVIFYKLATGITYFVKNILTYMIIYDFFT